jgi:hypothetical protein
MNHSRPARAPADFRESVYRQLNMYALAAGTAGVGMLALTQHASQLILITACAVESQATQGHSFRSRLRLVRNKPKSPTTAKTE